MFNISDDEETEDKKLGVAGMADVIGKILGKKVKDTEEVNNLEFSIII